ncbi:MAG: hypothetical protein ACFFDK_02125 [Promethearchaeota archaeon]
MSVEEKVCVRVLSSMISFAAGEIAKMDDAFKSKLAGIDEVIQWKIGDDIATYTVIKDQSIKGFDGIADKPTVTFEIEDVGNALKMLTGQVDASELPNIIKFSDAEKAGKLAFITETVAKYAEGLTGG